MRHLLSFIIVIASLVAWPIGASAQKRVALVIGNGAYEKVGRLPNPPSDAKGMEGLFRNAGFTVVLARQDLGVIAMRRALRDFSAEVRDADIAVVYYAGHGIEVNGTNYLIPVDAVLERDLDVEDEAVPLDRVIQLIEPAKRLRLVILDACRDNPFLRSMQRTISGRSIGRGLARVDVLSSDTLVAFAAKAGSTAGDGDGTNSPYASALMRHLFTPGLDLRLALGRVRDDVLKTTGNRQEPFLYGSLGGSEITLVPATLSVVGEAEQAWNELKNTSDTSKLEAFIARYKGTFFAEMAQERLAAFRTSTASLRSTRPAGGAQIGDVRVLLPPPTNYCNLDPTNPSDAGMRKNVESALSTTRLLEMSADCEELANWRTGKQKLLDHFAQYQTLSSWENSPLPGTPQEVIKSTCDSLRSQGAEYLSSQQTAMATRVEQVLKDVKINEMKFLGVIAEDPLVCYAVMLQKMRTTLGTDKTQTIIFATMIVNQKLVYYYLFAPYSNSEGIMKMLLQHRSNVARLQAENNR